MSGTNMHPENERTMTALKHGDVTACQDVIPTYEPAGLPLEIRLRTKAKLAEPGPYELAVNLVNTPNSDPGQRNNRMLKYGLFNAASRAQSCQLAS
ncbi:c841a824-d4ab-45cb-92a0-5bdc97c9833a [Thermothielavioides terrestris]|uniref:C841a824-d4ab-45cb-92a0-5bdc97c9833a n=1 Tax=Thermothielavioides terrestris TaxID=2587410 RepID=A0A446BS09_9PEZI|nr:c841a824-d4ab-45cb-92a0-5bdc97c9833a [Thermothielavioides terrestris]